MEFSLVFNAELCITYRDGLLLFCSALYFVDVTLVMCVLVATVCGIICFVFF
jgi:hypothetical protein